MHFHLIYPSWPKLPGQSRFDLPPLGVIQAAACVPEDVTVTVTDENVEAVDFEGDYDLVGVSMMLTCQTPRGYAIAERFREQGKTVVLGGLATALHVQEALQHADAVVEGEGEGLIEQMVRDVQAGTLQRLYRRDGFPDIREVPLPRRDLHDKAKHYSHKGWELVDLVETSRGCRFNCAPCCTPYLGGRQHRIKRIDRVLADIERCSDRLFIVDNSLEQSVEYQLELFDAMKGMGKRFVCHPISPDPKVLKAAREAGAWYVYHAVYTISDKIRDRIRAHHDHGIGVEGTILLGLDEHDEDFTRRFIDFLVDIDLDLAEFTVLTPFPHTRYYEQLEREGRIIDRDWSHYNAGRVVFQPKQMSPETLQSLYDEAWARFYERESQQLKMSRLFLDVVRGERRNRRRRNAATSPERAPSA